ncbi:RraA family protein [Rhodobacter sp. M37P]|uniref:RraA family protein n=2 Tax=Rhodobacter calidifons TaxID=2715277 RepID=A0ABX0G8R4_9RHOB|nr:RraA family protein [Rhodobacter calidifons]
MAALARSALDAAPPRFALAGLSMGGIVAMEVVRQAPERVERLALLDTNALAEAPEVRTRRMAYYRAMHDAPKPSVAVVEDLDWPHCIGAFWGEINTTVHKGFGMSGALTNGVVRDLGDLPQGFPVIAGSIGPSHGFVHVRSLGQPVRVMGLEVRQGDLIHADRHGAVVIPPEVAGRLGEAIGRLRQMERLILDPARQADFDFAAFEMAWSAFEKART